jgi:hypothetical protein
MKKSIQVRARGIPARLVIVRDGEKTFRKPMLDILREWVGLITASAGAFAVLLYLAGRSYAGGYFSSMNIPAYQVSFTLWEYGEVGWVPLLLYPVGMILIVSFLSWVFNSLFDWISPRFRQFVQWLRQVIKRWFPNLQFPEKSQETRDWFAITKNTFFVFLVIIVLIFTLSVAADFGKTNGRLAVLEKAPQVELVSQSIIPLDDTNIVESLPDVNGTYVYTGLRLLTFNDGKYYLFKDIDPITCKPIKVYIIETSEDIRINLLSPASLSDQCQTKVNPTITITPPQATPTP